MNAEVKQAPLAEYFYREQGKLLRYVKSILAGVGEADAEDIVQDVAAGLFHRADFTIPIQNMSAYIYRALKNRVVDFLRRKKDSLSLDQSLGHRKGQTLGDLIGDDSISVERDHEKRTRSEALYRAIDRLDERDRAVIIASEFEGRSFQELSRDWGEPLGTLLARKARALKKIKKFLEASQISIKEDHHV